MIIAGSAGASIHGTRFAARIAGAALVLVMTANTGWTAGVPLVPHRAVYDLRMGASTGPKGPAAAQGRIVYEMRGNHCNGYAIKFRQVTEVTPSQGMSQTSEMRSAFQEDAAGRTFRYRIDVLANGRLASTSQGSAERSASGISISVNKPAEKKINLKLAVTFPMQQTIRILEAARKGERVLEMKTYDGSDGGAKIYHSLQIISAPIAKPADDLTSSYPQMKGMKRWRVVASNFDLKKIDAPPLYVLKYELWENGVSSNVSVDYGAFTLIGTMSKLEMLKTKPCAK